MILEISTKSTLQLFVELADVIIWPVTVLLILLLFRRNFSDAILRLGTLKADKTGIELSFSKKIEATKKLFQQIKPATISKGGRDIKTFTEENDSAFGRILEVRSNLINYLKMISEREGVQTDGLLPDMISGKLKEVGAISIQQSRMINAMLETTSAANASATDEQAAEIENLLQKIEIH